jgi:hypothetical protein
MSANLRMGHGLVQYPGGIFKQDQGDLDRFNRAMPLLLHDSPFLAAGSRAKAPRCQAEPPQQYLPMLQCQSAI